MKNKIKLFLLLLLSIVIIQTLNSCNQKAPEIVKSFSMTDSMVKLCTIDTSKLMDVKNELKLFGKITPDNNKLAHIYPIVGGSIIKVNVELGDYVNKGQVLAVIRSGEIAQFQKEKYDALNNVAIAEKNLKVTKDLFGGKLNSEKDVVSSERELDKSKAELNRINEIYSIYKLGDGASYSIYAPISGFIVAKNINLNEQLRADKLDVLFSIAQIDEVWVLANVNEIDISKVEVGYDAQIKTISYPDKVFKGKIDRIFNTIDPSTKAMKVRIKIPNPDLLLKPEMNATVILDFSEHKSMVAINSEAIIFDKSKTWVMVYKSRYEIETRLVEVYRQLSGITYIKSGLKSGESVISKNGLLIYDELND